MYFRLEFSIKIIIPQKDIFVVRDSMVVDGIWYRLSWLVWNVFHLEGGLLEVSSLILRNIT